MTVIDGAGPASGGPAPDGPARDARTAPVAGQPAPVVREPLFDNVRFVAAVLVVLGHVHSRIADGPLADLLWSGTWAFRIPLYVVVAGWFTAVRLDRGRAVRLVVDVLVVYLVFDLIGSVQRWMRDGVWVIDPWLPAPGLWFLLSLLCWRLALPVVLRLAGSWALAWSVVASVAAGFVPALGTTWSAGRTVALFPLFVLGALVRRGERLPLMLPVAPRTRAWAAGGVVLLVATVGLVGLTMADYAFYLHAGYRGGLLDQVQGAGERLFLLGAAAAGVALLVLLVPRRRVPVVTYVGSGSLYVYLLHMVLLVELSRTGFFRHVDTAPEQVATMLGAAAVALLLGSRPVRALTRPLVQPRRFVASLGQSRRATSSTAA